MTRQLLSFDNPAGPRFKVDQQSRTITGLAVPFGVVGNNGTGGYRFSKGTLDWSKVKYLTDHDWAAAVGNVKFTETDEGLEMVAKIARGARGDEVLALHEPDPDTGEAVYDGLSIGLDDNNARFDMGEDGVYDCLSATVIEVSGTPRPAFKDAQVRSVTASNTPTTSKESNTMEKCVKCGHVHAAGVVECTTVPAFTKDAGDKLMADVQSLTEKIAELEKVKIPIGPGPQMQVTEEPIYRFAGTTPAPSGHDFATDLLAAGVKGDAAALERLQKFTTERLGQRFADQPTTTADTAAVNPSQYRPDMFLGQAPTPASPLYDFFHKGGLSNVTPFFWSKLDRANTDIGVADHTEDTDPEDRDLVTAAGATVTPTPVSGKVHITREVGDQGGNPQVSGLIWAEFERSLSIALESKTAALVNAAAVTELGGAIAAGSTDGAAAGRIVEAGLVGLQFLADGFRFTRAFGHIDLYKLLAAAEKGDNNADKLYPIINPQNATGQAASKWSYLDIGGWSMFPAASLGATNVNQKSYVADPGAVHVWNSGLQRLDKLSETVAGWDLGCFAYFAGIVYDVTGLRKITYDVTA